MNYLLFHFKKLNDDDIRSVDGSYNLLYFTQTYNDLKKKWLFFMLCAMSKNCYTKMWVNKFKHLPIYNNIHNIVIFKFLDPACHPTCLNIIIIYNIMFNRLRLYNTHTHTHTTVIIIYHQRHCRASFSQSEFLLPNWTNHVFRCRSVIGII